MSCAIYPQLHSHHNFIGLPQILAIFNKFQARIGEIEELIKARNQEKRLKNRYGNVAIPYELLYPSSDSGLTGKGVPNSTSIWGHQLLHIRQHQPCTLATHFCPNYANNSEFHKWKSHSFQVNAIWLVIQLTKEVTSCADWWENILLAAFNILCPCTPTKGYQLCIDCVVREKPPCVI